MKNWVVGNWKMNGSLGMISDYIPALLDGLMAFGDWTQKTNVAICPPHPFLRTSINKLIGYPIRVGAQNISEYGNGAYTGDVSVSMLVDLEVRLCLVGHSERRKHHGESDHQVAEKVIALLSQSVRPLLCVGETEDERESGQYLDVVQRQLEAVFSQISPANTSQILVAYEPVWAIGTGRTASPAQAGEMHRAIRSYLTEKLGSEAGTAIPLLYGGSVTGENAGELMAEPEINGTLVGGASLKADSFLSIIKHSLT